VSILEFRESVESAWSPETAYKPDPDMDPAWGQCAVTALLFHEHFGGQIQRAVVVGPEAQAFRVRHYWNVFLGQPIDLTWRQFPVGSSLNTSRIEDVDPSALKKSVQKRFNILKERFESV
jgi:hypothetical protein